MAAYCSLYNCKALLKREASYSQKSFIDLVALQLLNGHCAVYGLPVGVCCVAHQHHLHGRADQLEGNGQGVESVATRTFNE